MQGGAVSAPRASIFFLSSLVGQAQKKDDKKKNNMEADKTDDKTDEIDSNSDMSSDSSADDDMSTSSSDSSLCTDSEDEESIGANTLPVSQVLRWRQQREEEEPDKKTYMHTATIHAVVPGVTSAGVIAGGVWRPRASARKKRRM